MKLWIDDVRPAPEGYDWCKSVYEAQTVIEVTERNHQWYSDRAWELYNDGRFELAERLGAGCKSSVIELIDMDHDSGDFSVLVVTISVSSIGSKRLVAITPSEYTRRTLSVWRI